MHVLYHQSSCCIVMSYLNVMLCMYYKVKQGMFCSTKQVWSLIGNSIMWVCKQNAKLALGFLRPTLSGSQWEFTFSCSWLLRWQKKALFPQSHGQVGTIVAVCVCVCVCVYLLPRWCDVCGSDPNGPVGSVSPHPTRHLSDKITHLLTPACAHAHADI